jgi:SAM-dependent methyltransferase
MRESAIQRSAPKVSEAARQIPHDEAKFFESFYRVSIEGEPTDRMTIGGITEAETRFHYNATENSILSAFSRLEPLPTMAMGRAWSEMRRRRQLRLLDVGSGTGHWIDFFRDVLLVTQAVGIEITQSMAEFLERKYAADSNVLVLRDDVASEAFNAARIGAPVDYVSAIGVMFHIVDDARWRQAVRHLALVLKPGGIMFVGGDFGPKTRNVQFHRQDEFDNWKSTVVSAPVEQVQVNKRVRSLSDWQAAANNAGLVLVDLVRSDRDESFTTPENDVLVLRRPA